MRHIYEVIVVNKQVDIIDRVYFSNYKAAHEYQPKIGRKSLVVQHPLYSTKEVVEDVIER